VDAVPAADQVKEVEAAAERAAVQSAAIIEEAMAQAEDMRRKAVQESHSQVSLPHLSMLVIAFFILLSCTRPPTYYVGEQGTRSCI
jgi:hypothetical protein